MDAGAEPIDASSVARNDSSVADPDRPQCEAGVWDVAPGFTLAEPVDYVAARWSGCNDAVACPIDVQSARGEPCSNATDRAACEKRLARPGVLGHLATTQGDLARTWNRDDQAKLLAPIDRFSEAIWLVKAEGHIVPCNAKLFREDGALVIADLPDPHLPNVRVYVFEDGSTKQTLDQPPFTEAASCILLGCSDVVVLASDLDVTFEALRKSTFEACWHGECHSMPLTMLSGSTEVPTTRSYLRASFSTGKTAAELTVGTQDGTRLWLYARLTTEAGRELVRGDVYETRITDASGRVTSTMQMTIEERPQTKHTPCGESCAFVKQDTRADPDPWLP